MLTRPITEMSARNLVVITVSLEKRQDYSQRISLTNKRDSRSTTSAVIGDLWSDGRCQRLAVKSQKLHFSGQKSEAGDFEKFVRFGAGAFAVIEARHVFDL